MGGFSLRALPVLCGDLVRAWCIAHPDMISIEQSCCMENAGCFDPTARGWEVEGDLIAYRSDAE